MTHIIKTMDPDSKNMGQGNKNMVQDSKHIYGWSQIIASMPIMDDPSLLGACLFMDMGPNWAQAGPNLGLGPNRALAQTGPGTRDKPSQSKPAKPSQPTLWGSIGCPSIWDPSLGDPLGTPGRRKNAPLTPITSHHEPS